MERMEAEMEKFVFENVANGMWVVPVITGSRGEEINDEEVAFDDSRYEENWLYEIVGPKPMSAHVLERTGSGGRYSEGGRSWCYRSHHLLVGDAPFGLILITEENGKRSPYLSFEPARQVHKGELGRYPEYPRPEYAREGRDADELAWKNENLPEGVKPYTRRNLRRHHARWARLVDVAALIGVPPEYLVRAFYPFADSRGYGLPVLFAEKREEIHGQILPYRSEKRFTELDFPALFDRNPETIWVRQGFAKTVLCMVALGYVPPAPKTT